MGCNCPHQMASSRLPGRPLKRPMHRSTPARIYQSAKDKAGIHKAGGIHSLRHYSRIRLIRDLAPEAGGERARCKRAL